MEVIKRIIILLLPILLVSCSEQTDVSLEEFEIEADVFVSGKALMTLDYGLHLLEEQSENHEILLIGVHGSESRGYEWVYPLQTLDTPETLTLFFRWNDKKCPGPSYEKLYSSIDSLLQLNANLKEVVVIGHSYGALLVSMFLSEWSKDTPLAVHAIAGPLAGMPSINSLCLYNPPNLINNNVKFYEWRTIQALDGAFRDLNYDPQIVEIKKSAVTRLPETYKGNKLGHNWSISWVADEIKKTN